MRAISKSFKANSCILYVKSGLVFGMMVSTGELLERGVGAGGKRAAALHFPHRTPLAPEPLRRAWSRCTPAVAPTPTCTA